MDHAYLSERVKALQRELSEIAEHNRQYFAKRSHSPTAKARFEVLKSTLRTREYLEKGEQEGKTLLDAMRDGDTAGMQHFDGNIESLIRTGTIDLETGLAYATNPGNLRLELADLAQGAPSLAARTTPAKKVSREPELLIER